MILVYGQQVYRQDYILRLIEQLSRALADLRHRLLGRTVDSAEARAEIRQVARDAGLDLDVARRLDGAMLLTWLAPGGTIDEPKMWLMGELLYLEALAAQADGDDASCRADARRALAILTRLPPDFRPSSDLASAGERSEELRRLADSPTGQP
jgi:hypothetical protein